MTKPRRRELPRGTAPHGKSRKRAYDTTTKGGETLDPPDVFPTVAYAGVEDTGATYAVPIAVSNATGVKWSSDDSAHATASGGDASGTIKAVAAGSANVKVSAGGTTVTIPVTVTAYKAADRALGAAAYASKGCAGCHEAAGGPDITPSGIGKHSDEEVIGAFNDGQNPEGGPISQPNHRFGVDSSAKVGLVAHLRSLPAKETPKPD